MASDIGKFGVNSRHRKKMNLVLNSIIVLLVLTLIWIESGALVSKAAPETSVEEPATATTTMKAQSSAAGNWSSLYDLTPDQQALFFEQRRMEYSHRRDRIQSLCASISEDDPSHKFLHNIVFPKNLIYAPDHNVAYCQIAKVGSSTWTLHFVHLANPPQEEVDKHMQVRVDIITIMSLLTSMFFFKAVQVYAPALWPLPKDVKLEALAEEFQHELTALVVNRHPFSRLTSAYFQKVIDAGTYSKPWIKFNQRVIEQHRSEARKKEIEATAEVEDFEFAGDDPKFPRYEHEHHRYEVSQCLCLMFQPRGVLVASLGRVQVGVVQASRSSLAASARSLPLLSSQLFSLCSYRGCLRGYSLLHAKGQCAEQGEMARLSFTHHHHQLALLDPD